MKIGAKVKQKPLQKQYKCKLGSACGFCKTMRYASGITTFAEKHEVEKYELPWTNRSENMRETLMAKLWKKTWEIDEEIHRKYVEINADCDRYASPERGGSRKDPFSIKSDAFW